MKSLEPSGMFSWLKVRENNNGIIFFGPQKISIFEGNWKKGQGWREPICSAYGIFPKFYFFKKNFGKHKGRPDRTSRWHPQVKLIGRGPKKTRSFTSFTPLGLNPGSQNGLYPWAVVTPDEFWPFFPPIKSPCYMSKGKHSWKKFSITTTSIHASKLLPKHLIATRNGVQQPLFVFVEPQ